MDISIRFMHGLGDAANFCHVIPSLTSRGHAVEVECTPDKACLFRAAGASIVYKAKHTHPYPHAPYHDVHQYNPPWLGNKVAFGSFQDWMPQLGVMPQLWEEMCQRKLSLRTAQDGSEAPYVCGMLQSCPRPWILVHTRGNSTPNKTNLTTEQEQDLFFALLDKTHGTIIALDWDRRVAVPNSYRMRHMERDISRLDLVHLAALMEYSDLLIAVDSGPLHFARWTSIRRIGLWFGHYPAAFCLPDDDQLNLVDVQHAKRDVYGRIPYNTIVHSWTSGFGYAVAEAASDMLEPTSYLSAEHPAADVQLRHFVRRTASRFVNLGSFANRSRTLHLALSFLKKRASPVIVETGCVRKEEDWDGAGYSTYLFGAFVRAHGGKLVCYDNHESHLRTARMLCQPFADRVSFQAADSVEGLRTHPAAADLVYLDSLDVGHDGYREHCLAEAQAAAELARDDGRILIDDTPWCAGEWQGKGATAVPWLLSQGWRIVHADYQVLLRPPTAIPAT